MVDDVPKRKEPTGNENPFTDEDIAQFRKWQHQEELARPIIERDYEQLAGADGAWVAFRDGNLVAKGPDPDDVIKTVEAQGWTREDVYVQYLLGKDVIFIPTNFPVSSHGKIGWRPKP